MRRHGLHPANSLHIVHEAGRHKTPAATGEENLMAWKSPKIVEISLGCEINCYACADLKA
jgi:coenzyme PQQ precursor peptide PqqA